MLCAQALLVSPCVFWVVCHDTAWRPPAAVPQSHAPYALGLFVLTALYGIFDVSPDGHNPPKGPFFPFLGKVFPQNRCQRVKNSSSRSLRERDRRWRSRNPNLSKRNCGDNRIWGTVATHRSGAIRGGCSGAHPALCAPGCALGALPAPLGKGWGGMGGGTQTTKP